MDAATDVMKFIFSNNYSPASVVAARSFLACVLTVLLFITPHGSKASVEGPVTGAEMIALVRAAALAQGLEVTPKIDARRVFYKCGSTLNVTPRDRRWRTVSVSCQGDDGWQVSVRTDGAIALPSNMAQQDRGAGSVEVSGVAPSGMIPVVVYDKSLNAGDILRGEDLRLLKVPQSEIRGSFGAIKDLLGRELTRPVTRNDIVRARHLEPRYILQPGDVVRVINRLGAIQIESEAVVLTPARLGETLTVRNRGTGVPLRVRADGGKIVTLIAKIRN